jgi:hypothetical protein
MFWHLLACLFVPPCLSVYCPSPVFFALPARLFTSLACLYAYFLPVFSTLLPASYSLPCYTPFLSFYYPSSVFFAPTCLSFFHTCRSFLHTLECLLLPLPVALLLLAFLFTSLPILSFYYPLPVFLLPLCLSFYVPLPVFSAYVYAPTCLSFFTLLPVYFSDISRPLACHLHPPYAVLFHLLATCQSLYSPLPVLFYPLHSLYLPVFFAPPCLSFYTPFFPFCRKHCLSFHWYNPSNVFFNSLAFLFRSSCLSCNPCYTLLPVFLALPCLSFYATLLAFLQTLDRLFTSPCLSF